MSPAARNREVEPMKAMVTSRYAAIIGTMALALTTACIAPSVAAAATDDEAAIRALEDRFAAAFNAGDVDGIMKVYVPDESLVVFDVVPPRQYVGANAYRKDWVEFFGMLKGPPKFDITDLSITADGNLGFGHSIQRVRGMDPKGQPIDLTVRVTDAYRKIGGNWLIVHEHVSVPVDLETGKPDLSSKP
jgi:ketosteroid isomerase-like protein